MKENVACGRQGECVCAGEWSRWVSMGGGRGVGCRMEGGGGVRDQCGRWPVSRPPFTPWSDVLEWSM